MCAGCTWWAEDLQRDRRTRAGADDVGEDQAGTIPAERAVTNCALVIDRDLNAAINLARIALAHMAGSFAGNGRERHGRYRPSRR
jgi:hypothetical protein